MLPLQSVDLASTHSGEEPAGHVVPEVGPDGGPDLLHLFQRERPDVRSPPPEPLHTLECIRSAEALAGFRSEEHTSELQSLMRISYAVFCWKEKRKHTRLSYIHKQE